jgi:hypothetical protein
MMSLFFLIAIPVVLLILLALSGRRSHGEEATGLPAEAEYLIRLPERSLLDHCLSAEDSEFVAALRSPRLLALLVYERRRLALAWLRQTRREAGRLYRLHVRSVRHAAGLRPAAELRLLSAVSLFALVYALMVGTVWMYGPFRTRRFLDSLRVLAGVLSGLGSRIADSIGPEWSPQMHTLGGE